MKKSFWLIFSLACAGVICLFIYVADLENKKENKYSSSEEYKNIVDTDNPKEEQHVLEEEQKYFDTWETEHVREIEFGNNEYVTQNDVIHIGQLIHLRSLKISIGESEIDLSSLGNLEELETLDIDIQSGCSPDLSFAEKLSQLEKLDITVGSGVNLSPLGSLNKLRQLSMDTRAGDVADLSFLKNLNSLEELTFIKCCEIEDLSLFQNMPYLKRLDVAYVGDCDLNYLADLKNLEVLAIIGENIRNPEGLSDLTHLKSLSLYDNSSDAMYSGTERTPFDMQLFVNLTELEWLDLTYIYIEDISPLAEINNLRHISLVKTNVSDILPLASLEKLDELHLFGNRNELVKEQAETLFNEIEYKIITEEMPKGL